MNIYVLNRSIDYEGETTLGVFRSAEEAHLWLREMGEELGITDGVIPMIDVYGARYCTEHQESSTRFYVRQFDLETHKEVFQKVAV